MTNPRKEYHQQYRAKNRDRLIANSKSWYENNKIRAAETQRIRREGIADLISQQEAARYQADKERMLQVRRGWKRRMRLEALQAYGGKCACCGESNVEFLAIDHINGNGNKHRAETRRTGGLEFTPGSKRLDFQRGFAFFVTTATCPMAPMDIAHTNTGSVGKPVPKGGGLG